MSYPIVVLYHRSPPDLNEREGTQVNWRKDQSPNGIIPYLLEVMTNLSKDSCWISATLEPTEATSTLYTIKDGGFCSSRLYIIPEDYTLFYDIYSKQYLWPILHQYPEYVIELPPNATTSFIKVNKLFAQAACDKTSQGGTVWVHDYNLWLTPHFIKKIRPDIKVSFFFHTTFPQKKYLESLQNKSFFVESLLDCDLIGFHIPRFVNLCADWLQEYLVKQIDKTDISITYTPSDTELLNPFSALTDYEVVSELKTPNSSTKFVAKPLPVKYVNAIESIEGENPIFTCNDLKIYENKDLAWFVQKASQIDYDDDIRIIFSARCDYTKGAVELLKALKKLVSILPEIVPWLHVDFISVPSVVSNPVYNEVAEQIDAICNAINVSAKRKVIHLIDYCLPQKELYQLLQETDICCVPSIYDGLNMLAKEFISVRNSSTGRLILSRYAGASVELNEAILVDPFYTDDLLRGILLAIIDNPKSFCHSIDKMKQKMKSDSDKWSLHFLPFH
ncbi:trehalose-6-phosphate synthase [Gaetbulibacter jejuensis]|uniref:Glucosylglycerol-phosphate synthase n=1 Tax=Gaetbulibacter jejuensis TaxID=584607 RepID=A0ABN1JIA2_9FLAO